ncbi:lysozyme inhibitor LprI family protein [Variovorax paradoxus]|uniref:lysozyme inhibitor LprI family protein n=1 Tax=Variovorax paradoxus TaxID=34073 RepID=UPI00278A8A82|nr:lysozyme inhibitor LprI family protein [Variovorax paradoxus]MDQ0586040.1 uncharacterized protein YecT (DUF1311 family) [Variovorax paradoxus]
MYIPCQRISWMLGTAMSMALPSAQAATACEDKAQNQAQLTACAAADLKQANARLNQLYREMQTRLSGDQRTVKLLVDAQKKWLGFRDAECALQTVRTTGGSIQSMNVASCLAALTQSRAKDFENLLGCSLAAGEQERASCAIPREASR